MKVLLDVVLIPLFIIFLLVPYAFIHLIAWLAEMRSNTAQPKY